MDKLLKIIVLVFINYFWVLSIEAQTCYANIHFDNYMKNQFEKDIQGSVENSELVKQQIMQSRKSLSNRSVVKEIRVLIVYQNVTSTQILPSLKKAEDILKRCVKDTDECKVSFIQINQPFNYVFTDSKNCYKATTDLMKAASGEGWYRDADLVIGVTGERMDDCGGYAFIGQCAGNIGRALITGIYDDYTNPILAHELGHILGMEHDSNSDLPNLMRAETVPLNAQQVGLKNQNCYAKSVNCTHTGSKELEFEATERLESNRVKWSTRDENNIEGFYLERSNNTQDWTILGFVKGIEGYNLIKNYEYMDKTPLPLSYYRLRYPYSATQEAYSYWAKVERSKNGEANFFPNPVENTLTFITDVFSKDNGLTIFDCRGRIVFNEKMQGGRHLIDFSNFSAGLYLLQIKNDAGEKVVKKLVKQ